MENDLLKMEVDSFGAELKSVYGKTTKREYMWQADPAYWNRTSPILFPFVGSVVNDKYTFEGQEYAIGQHGFARDSEFSCDSQSDTDILFSLQDDEKTKEKYPFNFSLQVGYILDGMSLEVVWRVLNPGQDRENQKLYFSIGGHPAFNCPINADESKEGYKLYFEGATELHHHGNLNGTCTREDIVLPLEANRAVITKDFFDRSTYMVENNQTGLVALETPDGKPYITVEFDAPLFGVWSPVGKNAPFVCIEPWYGRADYDDFDGDLTTREYGNELDEKQVWQKSYMITFGLV